MSARQENIHESIATERERDELRAEVALLREPLAPGARVQWHVHGGTVEGVVVEALDGYDMVTVRGDGEHYDMRVHRVRVRLLAPRQDVETPEPGLAPKSAADEAARLKALADAEEE